MELAAEDGRARRGRSYLRILAPPPISSVSVSGPELSCAPVTPFLPFFLTASPKPACPRLLVTTPGHYHHLFSYLHGPTRCRVALPDKNPSHSYCTCRLFLFFIFIYYCHYYFPLPFIIISNNSNPPNQINCISITLHSRSRLHEVHLITVASGTWVGTCDPLRDHLTCLFFFDVSFDSSFHFRFISRVPHA